MGGGAAGGYSDSTSSSITGPNIEEFARRYEGELAPLRGEFLQTLLSGLRTGGVGPGMPIIANAEMSSRDALNRTTRSLKGKGGLEDPLVARLLGQLERSGGAEISNIGPEFVQDFLKLASGTSQGALASILGSLGGQRSASSDSQAMQFSGSGGAAGGGGGGGGGGGSGNPWA